MAFFPIAAFAQGGSADFFKVKPTTDITEISSNPSTQIEQVYTEVENLIKKGEYNEALKKAENLIYEAPGSHIGYYLKGLAFMNSKKYDSALFNYDKVIEIQPLETSAYLNKVLVYLESGDFRQAVQTVDRLAAINKNDVHYLIGNGVLLATQSEYKQAIKSLKKAAQISELPYINWLLSISYLQLGKEDLAASEANNLFNKDPNSLLGKLLMAQFNATFLKKL